jgi:hypothetical protein
LHSITHSTTLSLAEPMFLVLFLKRTIQFPVYRTGDGRDNILEPKLGEADPGGLRASPQETN